MVSADHLNGIIGFIVIIVIVIISSSSISIIIINPTSFLGFVDCYERKLVFRL